MRPGFVRRDLLSVLVALGLFVVASAGACWVTASEREREDGCAAWCSDAGAEMAGYSHDDGVCICLRDGCAIARTERYTSNSCEVRP
jgi:hypothetical protein